MRARTAVLGAAAGLAGLATWTALDCRPRVLAVRALIRLTGTDEAPARSAALRGLVPAGVTARLDLRYDPADRDARLDVFAPAAASGPLPVLVWVHGGGWIGGTKNDMREYLQLLAGRGFVTVGVDYSPAPRRRYPTPVRQVNAALAFLAASAGDLGIDPTRFGLAGDSAGAQIAAQAAAAITDPAYARAAGLPAALAPGQLRATVLLCGMYDLAAVAAITGRARLLADTVLWAYSGCRDHLSDPAFAFASVSGHVSAAFPPAFVSAGNGDPLEPQSRRLAEALRAAGVPVDELFFDGHEPPLPHEYHLDLPAPAAQLALDRIAAHVHRHTGGRREETA